jgi:hypothetical protein
MLLISSNYSFESLYHALSTRFSDNQTRRSQSCTSSEYCECEIVWEEFDSNNVWNERTDRELILSKWIEFNRFIR